jgi:hypothetical protein
VQSWLFCQKPMKMYDAIARIDAPVARPVQAVGDVDSVRGAHGDEDDPDQEQPAADDRPEEHEVEPRDVPEAGDHRGRGCEPALVRERERQDGEHRPHDDLPGDLRPTAEPEAALVAHLEEVVEEPDHTEADHHEQHEHPAERELVPADQVADEVAEHGADDQDDAAHGRRAALRVVGLRAVVADELAPAEPVEELDERRRHQQREGEGEPAADQQRDHAVTPARRSPRRRRPADLDDFTRTTSPARRVPCRRS